MLKGSALDIDRSLEESGKKKTFVALSSEEHCEMSKIMC